MTHQDERYAMTYQEGYIVAPGGPKAACFPDWPLKATLHVTKLGSELCK